VADTCVGRAASEQVQQARRQASALPLVGHGDRDVRGDGLLGVTSEPRQPDDAVQAHEGRANSASRSTWSPSVSVRSKPSDKVLMPVKDRR
jgi:hypothetical protein